MVKITQVGQKNQIFHVFDLLFIDEHSFQGSRTIAAEKKCPLALILTLTLNQTLTLIGGQFSLGAIVRIPFLISQKS